MKRYHFFNLLAIFLFLSQAKCRIFDTTDVSLSTVLPIGPQISINYTHTKFRKDCNNGVCVYNITIPGMSNELYSYIKSKIDNDKIIEATDETIEQNLSNQFNTSLQNIEDNVRKIEDELGNLTSIYTDLLNKVEATEINLQKTDESLASIQEYVNEMNQTSNDNSIYLCYVKAYEDCSESPSTILPNLSTSSLSSASSEIISTLPTSFTIASGGTTQGTESSSISSPTKTSEIVASTESAPVSQTQTASPTVSDYSSTQIITSTVT
uniref:DUF148 domain-containing protein n=1 Tax=Strongyloides papillosus TaxID=174720 RepID=A0A0N5BVL3_STREA